ncbi:MAG: AAA family ATPase, partial [Nitrospirae bacterium]|nr:AAA family ATPase [Nitrospirota bacterium]
MHQTLAKITRPKFTAVLQRKRQFSLIDRFRKYPVIWVNGPPGSGKTILISSYLETRKIRHIWYQVDPRDSDVATLFYYLGLAARKVSTKKTPLPLLTPEYIPGLSTFAHHYFEELFSRLKPPSCIVFDNYHEVPLNILFNEVICNGLAVLPHGINITIISRGAPPPEFSRFMANDLIATISWEDLRLNQAESMRISRLKHKEAYPAAVIKDIYRKTDGWATGFVLLLETSVKGANMGKLTTITPDTISDYFNSEIIKRLDRDIHDFLLKTSLFPSMDHEMAKDLTGLEDARQVLSYLSRNNCFTERRYLHEPVYQYNPLFREYLLLKLEGSIITDELQALKKKASSILANSGRYEDAFELFKQCSDWEGMIRLVTEQANNLIMEGRERVLEDWIKDIPGEISNKSPWLLYWLGICRIPFNQAESRGLFKNAFQLFLGQNDATGAYLSWSGFVDSCCFGLDDLKPLDDWIGIP